MAAPEPTRLASSRHAPTHMTFERPSAPPPRPAELALGVDRHGLTNGLVAFLFAATGPLAILLAVAADGGLSSDDISSWAFGSYGLGGVISIIFSIAYRQPIAMAWTIPGTVLLIPAFDHLSFAEIIGAYFASGVLIAVLGATGWVGRIMAAIPLPIVMGMVAGVFLPFGLSIVSAFHEAFWVSLATVAAFIGVSLTPALMRVFPPVLGALVAGLLVVVLSGQFAPETSGTVALVRPNLYLPAFSPQAMVELVIPLTLTVVAIQNAQGFTVLRAAGYEPPVNVLTFACGVATLGFAAVGSVPACVTGPANAILNSSGRPERRYVGGVVFGVLMLLFGLFSPLAIGFALGLPTAFIAILGGLAMLRVLQTAFTVAFSQGFPLSALIAFLVTVSDLTIAGVGAAFWGLVFGFATAWTFERDHFAGRPTG
jgi:benzoate membrane transport protein